MNVIYFSNHFKRQIKPLLKKFPRLLDDLSDALKTFNTADGLSLGANAYKIRIRCRDLAKGKSHAFRMILLFVHAKNLTTPVILYFKGDRANVTKREIVFHASRVRQELKEIFGI